MSPGRLAAGPVLHRPEQVNNSIRFNSPNYLKHQHVSRTTHLDRSIKTQQRLPFCLWGESNPRGRPAHPELIASDGICFFLGSIEMRMKGALNLMLPPGTTWLKMTGYSSIPKWGQPRTEHWEIRTLQNKPHSTERNNINV